MVLDGLLSPQECDELRQRMEEIVEEMDVPEHCRTVFSTYHDEQTKTQVTQLRWPLSLGSPVASLPVSTPLASLLHVLSYLFGLQDAGRGFCSFIDAISVSHQMLSVVPPSSTVVDKLPESHVHLHNYKGPLRNI